MHLNRNGGAGSKAYSLRGEAAGSRHARPQRLRMNLFPDLFGAMRGGGPAGSTGTASLTVFPSTFHDSAPSWDSLDALVSTLY